MKIKNFFKDKGEIPSWILTAKEERNLTESEKEAYLDKLYLYCKERNLEVTTDGATTLGPKLKGITNVLTSAATKLMAGAKFEKIVTGLENIPEGPVLFASTHQGILDNMAWIPECPKHAMIVHAIETNKLLLAVQLNTGLILATKNKEYAVRRVQAKLDMITALINGHSVWIFPETTWNLSPNKLHLPMNYGFLDAAQKASVPVVPVVMEYTYDSSTEKEKITRIHVHYGKSIQVRKNDNIIEKLEEYSAAIATSRWELFEEKGLFKRRDISNWDYINYLKGNYANLEFGKKDRISEHNGIQGANDEFYVFHHLNDVAFDEDGNLLGTPEEERLKKLDVKKCVFVEESMKTVVFDILRK